MITPSNIAIFNMYVTLMRLDLLDDPKRIRDLYVDTHLSESSCMMTGHNVWNL